MLVERSTQSVFCNGWTEFIYQPLEIDITERIQLQVKVGSIYTTAVLDTGSPYVVCSSNIATAAMIRPDILEETHLKVRGGLVPGILTRQNLDFIAAEGESMRVDATFFIEAENVNILGEMPLFIGLKGCLERMRYAVDPEKNRFYYGSLGEKSS